MTSLLEKVIEIYYASGGEEDSIVEWVGTLTPDQQNQYAKEVWEFFMAHRPGLFDPHTNSLQEWVRQIKTILEQDVCPECKSPDGKHTHSCSRSSCN
jgi:hypothetical protein